MNLWALGLYKRAAAKRQFCIGERESMGRDNGNKGYLGFGIVTVLSVIVFLGIMSLFTGKGLFDTNVYNTYALQADSWRQGRLDLGWSLQFIMENIIAASPHFRLIYCFP